MAEWIQMPFGMVNVVSLGMGVLDMALKFGGGATVPCAHLLCLWVMWSVEGWAY